MTRECYRTHSNSATSPLYQNRQLRHIDPNIDSAMGCDAGYPKTSALIRRHALRQQSDVTQRHTLRRCRTADKTARHNTTPAGRSSRKIRLRRPDQLALRRKPGRETAGAAGCSGGKIEQRDSSETADRF
jgi:hypothetical protein